MADGNFRRFAEYCATRDLTSSERVSKGSEEYAALKEEFGQYRQLMLEDRQQMLRETQELLLSVRHQFETYRNTAEEVLAAEMHNIDHHLNMHKRLCDMEIKIYRKESEHLYEVKGVVTMSMSVAVLTRGAGHGLCQECKDPRATAGIRLPRAIFPSSGKEEKGDRSNLNCRSNASPRRRNSRHLNESTRESLKRLDCGLRSR